MGFERFPYLIRRIRPFNAGIKAFRVLTENRTVDDRFFDGVTRATTNEIKRVALEGFQRANALVEIEVLPQTDDRAVVFIPFAL
jgi:hypothetical protein